VPLISRHLIHRPLFLGKKVLKVPGSEKRVILNGYINNPRAHEDATAEEEERSSQGSILDLKRDHACFGSRKLSSLRGGLGIRPS
jgi:hypothetical protein